MQSLPPREQKSEIRKFVRERLKLQSNAEKHLAALSLVRQVYDWVAQHPEAKIIALYSALANEPQLQQIHQMAEGIEFVYPLVGVDGQMQFCSVQNHADLKAGSFGIQEPRPSHHPEVAPQQIDAFFCPGVAFTACGKRLGKGGGYYDRVLKKRSQHSLLIGIAFRCQLLDDLPTDTHDIAMDLVLTA